MDSDQGRAVWDDCLTDVLITACVDQILNKQRRGHGFTKDGWKNIVSTFQQKTGRDYGQKQFRNKLDVLKKELKTWDDLNKETGAWVQEILATHGTRCHDMFRVEKDVFQRLCGKLVQHGLRNSRSVGVEEKLAMFLLTVGHGVSNRVIQELFQHSGETVSRHLHTVLQACLSLARENITPEDPQFRGCHTKIKDDPRYYPYFKDDIGAIDGTHIKCVITGPGREKFIGRKGEPTQNVMAVCDWDMCFTFVLAGWESSAHDARVFHHAISNLNMNFPEPPEGKYYLVDSGYPSLRGYLAPYKRERYHLPEFRRQPGFVNPNKVFNFYHSSLRCTIERTFGVWKNRFEMLQKMRKYSFETQVHIVCATMAIHNFIRRNSQTDADFRDAENENLVDPDTEAEVSSSSDYIRQSSTRRNKVRDEIRDQIVRSMRFNQ